MDHRETSPPESVSPRVTLAQGDAPDQDRSTGRSDGTSLFEEALGDFNHFEGQDAYSDEE